MTPPPPLSPRLTLLLRLCLGALATCLVLLNPLAASASLLHLAGPEPGDLGVREGHLAACATAAHCSRAEWPVADPRAALANLLPAVLALDGVAVVDTCADYLHATVSSRMFGFVDDLELHAEVERGVLEARSVSRLGDSDLGVNARRLESLRRALVRLDS
ncbi:MAG: DUF1499 domain-containing protein [Cyanobium sp.]